MTPTPGSNAQLSLLVRFLPSPSPSSRDVRVRVEDVGILEQLNFCLLYANLFIVRDVNKR